MANDRVRLMRKEPQPTLPPFPEPKEEPAAPPEPPKTDDANGNQPQ
jgi:hypothetical protein